MKTVLGWLVIAVLSVAATVALRYSMTAQISVDGRAEGCHADHTHFNWPSEILAVTYDAAPYLAIYSVEQDGARYLETAMYSLPSERPYKVAFSRGARFLAVTYWEDQGVTVFERLPEGYFPIYTSPRGSIDVRTTSVAFSHGDPLLLVVGGFNAVLKLYRIDLGVDGALSVVAPLSDPDATTAGPVWDLKFSPDDAYLAAAHGGGTLLGDGDITESLAMYLVDGQSLTKLPPFQDLRSISNGSWVAENESPGSGMAVAFTRDAQTLAFATIQDFTHVFLYTMDPVSPYEIAELTYTQTNAGQSLAFYDNSILAHSFWGVGDQVSVYNLGKGEVLVSGLGVGFEATEVAFSEEQYLAVSATRGSTPVNIFKPLYFEGVPEGEDPQDYEGLTEGELIGFEALEIEDMVEGEAHSLAFATVGNWPMAEEEE